MFRQLLNASEKRHLTVLELLAGRGGWSFDTLSQAADYSVRTIKTDIKFFQEGFSDLFTISTSKNNHIIFTPLQPHAVAEATMRLYKDNQNVQFIKLVFEKTPVTKAVCAEELLLSYSSLDRSVKQINEVMAQYHLKVLNSPYRIKGREHHIRYFFGQFYWSIYHKFTLPTEREILQKSQWYVETLLKKDILDLSPVLAEKASYFLAISLEGIRKGYFMESFRSPLCIPEELEESMDRFLAQFWFPIPSNDAELMLFYFLPFYKDKHRLFCEESKEVLSIKQVLNQYMEKLMETTELHLNNQEELIDQLVVQYVYKNLFQGMSFLMGPTVQMDFLGSLEREYQPFIMVARELLEKKFIQDMGMRPEEKDAFIYWLITRWEGLAEQIQAMENDKPAILIMSELGAQQEVFLKKILKRRFAPQLDLMLHTEHIRPSDRVRFVLTDTYSQLINSSVPHETIVVRMDYNHFEESIRKLENEVARVTKESTMQAKESAPRSTNEGKGYL